MFAPENVLFGYGDGTWQGSFRHKETDAYFEYSLAKHYAFGPKYDMRIWMCDGSFRYAKVLKTRVYVVVDEDENGPVVEKWLIKQHKTKG